MFEKLFFKKACLIIMMFCLVPFGVINANGNEIKDIKGHWAESDIEDWLDKGLINGYPDGTFRPDNVISRGEFVALINRVFKYSEKSTVSFKDLKSTDWAYIDVQKAIAQGYINGFNDNSFRSNNSITRQETAVILSKILKLDNKEILEEMAAKDSALIPSWSKTAINQILAKGIMSKFSDETFQPQRVMTRAEAVVAIKKARASSTVVYDKAGTYGEDATNTVYSDVIIQSPDVTLKNMHIIGDLIIAKEVGDGNAYLNQVQVDGLTRIEGGGVNSIHINNSQLSMMTVNRSDRPVRIVAEGTSSIQDTQILSSAIIEENNISGEGFVNLAVLPETVATNNRTISFIGHFNHIAVGANVHEFTVRSGNIISLLIKENLVIPNIILNKGATIEKLELNSKSTISGEGKIKEIILSEAAKGSVLPDEEASSSPVVGGGGGGSTGGDPGTVIPALAATKITAANGSINVVFNKNITEIPKASDFTVLQKIDNGEYQKVDISLIHVMADNLTVQLTVPLIGISEADQVVVYSVSYKSATALLAPAFTVDAPTVVTASPTAQEVLYEGSLYITGKAESNSTVVVRRFDGTVIGQGKADASNDAINFVITLESLPVAGETLYLTAKGYEKLTSEPIEILVETRPTTETPSINGKVYSNSLVIRLTNDYLPEVKLFLKDMDGNLIKEGSIINGVGTFIGLELTANQQYQVTALAPEMKESEPFIFTVIAPFD